VYCSHNALRIDILEQASVAVRGKLFGGSTECIVTLLGSLMWQVDMLGYIGSAGAAHLLAAGLLPIEHSFLVIW
jgi:hypothetical protein